MTIPTIKFSGESDSGKTTTVCQLVEELSDRGYSVGVLKHDPNDHWQWDKRGTDTDRHAKAGADAVSILSGKRHGLYQSHNGQFDVAELIRKMDPEPDLVLLEGFKSRSFPGFEATGEGWEDHDGNQFSGGNVETLADRVEQLADLERSHEPRETHVRLTVDGEDVPLKSFPKSALVEVIEGYIRSLNDVQPGQSLSVEIDHAP